MTKKEELFEKYIDLVKSIAKKEYENIKEYSCGVIDYDDLFQAGVLGLLKTIDTYDPDKVLRKTDAGHDASESHYFSFGIYMSISNEIRFNLSEVYINPYTREKYKDASYENFDHPIEQKSCKMINLFSSMEYIPIEEDEFIDNEDAYNKYARYNNLDELVDNNLLRKYIEDRTTFLTEREKDILYKFYGLSDEGELSIKEIACIYHVTQSRIRQIIDKAIMKIRFHSKPSVLKEFY